MIGRPSAAPASAGALTSSTLVERGAAGLGQKPGGRTALLVAVALGIAAFALPARGTALLLVGADSSVLSDVITGAWIFKFALLLHAAIVFFGSRVRAIGRGALATEATATAPLSRASLYAVLGLVAVGAALRFVDLGAGLWFDEIRAMLFYGRSPLREIIATYDSQNQHLLYSLLARVALLLFGESGAVLRLPAVLFGVASLGAVYWFGSMVTTRREAFLATALITFSYHHLWFSQNARGYTALLLLTLVSSGLLLRLLTREAHGWRPALAYAFTIALAVFTHVTAVLVVAAHGLVWLALLWSGRKRAQGASVWLPFAAFVLAGSLAFQLYALALPQFLDVLTRPSLPGAASDWKNPLWFIAETMRGLRQGIPGGYVALAAAALVGVAGIVSYVRQSPSAAAVMLLPGIATAAAVLVMEHNLWPRFFFFCAGFAVLIAVRGVFTLCSVLGKRAEPVATVVLALVILASATTLPRAWAPKQNYAGAKAYIDRVRTPGDAVVAVDLAAFPFDQYLHAGWQTVNSEAELEQIERTHQKTYVLYIFPTRLSTLHPDIWERLERQYSTATELEGTLGGGAIIVKVRS